ncbi:MAG: GDSL-type esterase/lipase family protein [Gammaproteobacteria bacterium]
MDQTGALPLTRSNAPCPAMRLRERLIRIALWSIVAVLLAACSDPRPTLPSLAGDAVVLAFGDSLTRGPGAARGAGYPEVLAGLIEREVVNAGVPGERSAAGLARLGAELDRVRPALLLLCHGGNDILRKTDPARTRANLEAMIAQASERDIAVLLIGVPRPGVFLSTAELYYDVANATATPLAEDILAEILGTATLKSDTIHPNAAGYRRLAEHLHERLVEFGAL